MRIRLTIAALLLGLLAYVPATQARVGSTAVAAKKKKCQKKARWKCAPMHYHLSASGTVGGFEVWSAEINMFKWRASAGQIQYAQESGTLTLRAGWTGEGPTYELPTCGGDVRFDVPEQTMSLPKGDGFRFNAFLTFYLIGDSKNRYDFIVADDYQLAQATGTETCLRDSSRASFPYWLISTNNFDVLTPGRPGARRLTGSRSGGGDSVSWTLTRK
jgi:hypothetical protein